MRRAIVLFFASFLLLGASQCSRSVQSPLDTGSRCFFEPWRPNC